MVEARYYKDSDFEMIKDWYAKRGIHFNDKTVIPSVGFIVDDLAACFVYMTDSSICFLEGMVTNPSAEKSLRKEAFNSVVVAMLSYAKTMGVKYAKCETKIECVAERIVDLGFRKIGNTVSMVKEI